MSVILQTAFLNLCMSRNINCCMLIWVSLKFIPNGPFINKSWLVQIADWHWTGDKPSSEPMKTPHICVTVIQFVLVNTWTHLGVFKLISPECRIYASVNQVSLGSGNGLSPGRRQAITWTNAHVLSIRPSGIKFNENFIEIQSFSFMKMYLKMLSAKWRLGGNELNKVKWLQPVWWPLVHPNLHTNTGIYFK